MYLKEYIKTQNITGTPTVKMENLKVKALDLAKHRSKIGWIKAEDIKWFAKQLSSFAEESIKEKEKSNSDLLIEFLCYVNSFNSLEFSNEKILKEVKCYLQSK